ncbi:glycosyltransferase family 2 protein [Fulvivirga aurantia]|uniref:glycosyltransferase family 2 protein n=1 Tax=Fulvivirga aurantia TaxID=2529383 RepID=UPI001FEB992A|nr:glycosyltransferase family 2 protein [Fulvivirga aurantia]
MKVSVIISTYNKTDWLEKVLWGYTHQEYKNFELVIADDGSGPETKELLDQFANSTDLDIVHVWHEDRGFQKSQILNKAIVATSTEYLIFSDGDCIPRKDFVKVHVDKAEKGYFLSGGYFKLPMSTSKLVSKEDIISQKVFDKEWLYNNGLEKTYKTMKLTASGFKETFLNNVTPTKATWNGHNASGWKEDLVYINGFNEEMQYGGQDRELGERLFNYGIKSKQIRYSAICVHLDHKRGYKTPESMNKNKAIRKHTRTKNVIKTPHGINKL